MPEPGTPAPTPESVIPTPFSPKVQPDTINILLMGSDRRNSRSYRTDTLIIVSIRPKDRLVTLISIPRDLYVVIPEWTTQRINTAYLHGELSGYPGGGPALIKETILYNFGVNIDHIAGVEFDGFRHIVDTLGGIDVPLACPFTDWHIIDPQKSDQDEENWELYTIGPGLVHMDGDLALWYARSRKRSSDFDRGRRQQEILRAIYARSMQLNVVPRLPQLYLEFSQAINTDLTLNTILDLAPMASSLHSPQIRSYYIGRKLVTPWRTPQGAAVLLPNGPQIQAMLEEALGPAEAEKAAHMTTQVEIWNGTENADWDVLAAERLHYGGFDTKIALADQLDYPGSLLYDYTIGQEARQSEILLKVLGLRQSNLVPAPGDSSQFSYRLILGEDYNPCFNPVD